MRSPPWLTEKPIAHRGLHDAQNGVIENTFSAAEAAVSGNYAIEIDVRLAAGGVVVFHDGTLDRLSNEAGQVGERTLASLATVKLNGTDDKIPSFAEFLDMLSGRTGLFVEIKTDPGKETIRLAEQVIADLKGYSGPVAVMSFSPRIMTEIKSLAPHLIRGLVSGGFQANNDHADLTGFKRFYLRHLLSVPRVAPHFVAYDVKALPAFAPAIYRKTGRPLLSWTVRTPQHVATVHKHADQMIFEDFCP